MRQRRGEIERLLRSWLRGSKTVEKGRPEEADDAVLAQGWAEGPGLRLVEQRLRHVEEELGELRGRVNGLLFTVIGAVVVQVVLRLLG